MLVIREARTDPESRLYDLEASLQRALRQWSEAMSLVEEALALSVNPEGQVRILLKLAFTLEQKGDALEALAVLDRTEPVFRRLGVDREESAAVELFWQAQAARLRSLPPHRWD